MNLKSPAAHPSFLSHQRIDVPLSSTQNRGPSEGDFASTWYLEHRSPAQSAEQALQLVDGTSPSYGSVVTTFGTMEREFQLAD